VAHRVSSLRTVLVAINVILMIAGGCRRPTAESTATGPIALEDVSDRVGINFRHTDGSSGRRYILEPMSAGLALFDYDGDGRIDIYFLNGAPLPGYQFSTPPRNALWRNNGDGTFSDVTDRAGVGDTGFGLGVTVADYDNDGHPDIFLNNYGRNVLYHNQGDGTFEDVTEVTGVAGRDDCVGAGALFLDIEGDGDLDLYVGNYLRFDPSMNVERMVDGMRHYPSPRDYLPIPDSLFRNDGDGKFTDISEESGIAAVAGTAMGMIAADVDDDGDTDIFVLNDVAENFLFVNDGSGRFEERAVEAGLAYNAQGEENASMGVDAADYDHDGRLDFYMTAYEDELTILYKNLGGGFFEDVTRLTDAGQGTYFHVNWGVCWADFDNDGNPDVFVANGHTEDNAERRRSATAWRVANLLLRNTGDGKFVDVSSQAGSGMRPVFASRGAAVADLDNDGDLDLVILNSRETPTIVRNDTRNGNHWVQIILEGKTANRDGVGSQVKVIAGDLVQLQERHSGRGYQSHWGDRLHFGLGKHTKIDRVEVRWMGGTTETYDNLPVDRFILLRQGSSKHEVLDLPKGRLGR